VAPLKRTITLSTSDTLTYIGTSTKLYGNKARTWIVNGDPNIRVSRTTFDTYLGRLSPYGVNPTQFARLRRAAGFPPGPARGRTGIAPVRAHWGWKHSEFSSPWDVQALLQRMPDTAGVWIVARGIPLEGYLDREEGKPQPKVKIWRTILPYTEVSTALDTTWMEDAASIFQSIDRYSVRWREGEIPRDIIEHLTPPKGGWRAGQTVTVPREVSIPAIVESPES